MDSTTKAFESIKSFSGGAQENVRDWCDRAEFIFNAFKVNDDDRLGRIAIKLENSAFDWYRDNQGPYSTWTQFRFAFENAFPPPSKTQNRHLLAEQIKQRRQDNDESVHDYFYALDKLCREYDPRMSPLDKTIKLVGGLRPQLKEKVLPLNVQTPEAFLEHAKNFESTEKVMANHFHYQMESVESNYQIESNPYSSIAVIRSTHRNDRQINMFNSSQPEKSTEKSRRFQNHRNEEINSSENRIRLPTPRHQDRKFNHNEQSQNNYRSSYMGVTCFRCGRRGHIQRNCVDSLNDYKDQ